MTDQNYALTHLYHPTGTKVDVPLSLFDELTVAQATTLIRSVDALLMAGFTVNLPGLNDGEQYEQIGFAVRRSKENDDHTTTPVMDVYPVTGTYRILGLYLNTATEINAFEQATGLRIASMPEFDGSPIERGAKAATDKYVVALASPAKLVWKLNPKWEGENDKKHAKRMFVRWDGLRPVTTGSPETTMTVEEAGAMLTPGGKMLATLSVIQLRTLSTTTAKNVTDELRQAAVIILQDRGE
ncbi:MAG: hypothetical protein WCK35_11175 [Chloroflexota bacterium]